jgi:hypothetical protein
MKSFLKLSGGLFLAAFTAMAMAETKPAPIVQATPLPDHQVSFEVNGREWTRAHFGHGLKRPFLYPVIGPSGRTLTRMGHPRDPVSHSHHNSVWLSHAKVNNVDFWSDSGTGRIVHQRLEKLTDGDDDASATTFNLWIDEAKHQTLLAERRRVKVLPKEGGAALIVIDSQLEAKTDVVFGKTPFGFLGVRMAKSIGVRDGGGTIRNSAGGIDEKGVLWKAAKWVDYSGTVTRDVKRLEGIALFDHPQNPNHPSVFHVRDDGWMGASFSFAAPVELAKGKTLRLRYGLYVHDTLTSAALEACWREFAKSKLDDLVSRTPSPTIEVVAGGGTAVEGKKDSPTEHIKPPKNVDHNAATADGLRKLHKRYFEKMDDLVLAVNKKLGKQVVFVVPVGQAVIALREKIIAGKAPGLKSQEDLFSDGLGHPRPTLQVLMAYCHYAAIYRQSPIGLPVPKELAKAKDAEALNRLLQELAWDAVVHHRLSGVTRK